MRALTLHLCRGFAAALLLFMCIPKLHASFERSGSWFDPANDGEGFIIQYLNDDQAVIFWFTYDAEGAQRWFTGLGNQQGNALQFEELLITEGGVFGEAFDPAAIVRSPAGELSIIFSGEGENETGIARYVVDGVEGQQDLIRATRTIETMAGGDSRVPRKSGSWFDVSRDGEGFVIEILPDGRPLAYWFTYDLAGRQAWMVGIGQGSLAQGSMMFDLQQPVGGRFGPDFNPADVVREDAGEVRLSLACEGGFARFSVTDTVDFSDLELDLSQLIGVGPNVCDDPQLNNLFPLAGGAASPPDSPAGKQLAWLLDWLARTGPISDEELLERFSSAWLQANDLGSTRTFLEELRRDYPNGRWIDPVFAVPSENGGVISGSNGADFYYFLRTNLTNGKIASLSATPFGSNGEGSVIYGFDAALNLDAAADKFMTLSPEAGVLLARIDESNQCQPLVARQEDVPRSIGSVFKMFILGGLAEALDERATFPDVVLPLDPALQVLGGPLGSEPAGTPMTVDELAIYMLGISDNTATDMLLQLAGRERFNGLHAAYGHQQPELMSPQLGINEQFHLFFSFPLAESRSYVEGTELFQQTFLEERIVPLGPISTGGGGFYNESLLVDGAWQASPMDICGAFARHRQHRPGSDAALLVERALQAAAAQPNLRENWDRVWYKGGSLESVNTGLHVLTHAFMLEREGEAPYVLVGFSNNPNGGLESQQFNIQSLLGRMAQIADRL